MTTRPTATIGATMTEANELIATMKEFGLEAHTLGTEEDPSLNGVAIGDMLMEIIRLRAIAAERHVPVPSDEELKRVYFDASEWLPHDEGIRAVREALTAPGNALEVPEVPEGWQWVWMQAFWDPTKPAGANEHYEAKVERISGRDSSVTWKRVTGTGSTWPAALAAAIAQAKATT